VVKLRLGRRQGVKTRRGALIEIRCETPQRLQLDGDPSGDTSRVFCLSIRRGVLPVLIPLKSPPVVSDEQVGVQARQV